MEIKQRTELLKFDSSFSNSFILKLYSCTVILFFSREDSNSILRCRNVVIVVLLLLWSVDVPSILCSSGVQCILFEKKWRIRQVEFPNNFILYCSHQGNVECTVIYTSYRKKTGATPIHPPPHSNFWPQIIYKTGIFL